MCVVSIFKRLILQFAFINTVTIFCCLLGAYRSLLHDFWENPCLKLPAIRWPWGNPQTVCYLLTSGRRSAVCCLSEVPLTWPHQFATFSSRYVHHLSCYVFVVTTWSLAQDFHSRGRRGFVQYLNIPPPQQCANLFYMFHHVTVISTKVIFNIK